MLKMPRIQIKFFSTLGFLSAILLTSQQQLPWPGIYQITQIGFQPGQEIPTSTCCLPIKNTLTITQNDSSNLNKLTFSMNFDYSCINSQFTGPYSITAIQNSGIIDDINVISVYFPNNTIFFDLVTNCNWLLNSNQAVNTSTGQNWSQSWYLTETYPLQKDNFLCCAPINPTKITQTSANSVAISMFFSQDVACQKTGLNGTTFQLQENVFGGSFVDLNNSLVGFYYSNNSIGIVTLSTNGPGCLMQFQNHMSAYILAINFSLLIFSLMSLVYIS